MKSYSRRELYAAGEFLGDSSTERKLGGGYVCGGGGGGGGQTQSTSYQTNLPEYAQPYVETMLNATQQQLFNMNGQDITGFKPYVPYSTNPADYIAGFSPMQLQAQTAAAGLTTPGAYGTAQGMAGMAGLGQMGTTGQAGMYGRQGAGIGALGMSQAMPAFGAGAQYATDVTTPGTVGQYMSPYQQNVTDVAKAAAIREARMANEAANLASARSGTYGGARQALAQSERERNLLSNLSNIQATGSQNAYNQAIQNMQYGANLGLQGIQTGLQGIQAGQQGVAQGLAGVGAQQAGYTGAGQAAATLGSLAGQQLGAQQNIIGLQNQMGQQQQQQQQAIINQAIQDYATAQQYPLMQLGFMSNMLRGLPMQATTTQSYMPVANPLTQAIGTAGAISNLSSAFGGGKAAGGEIKSYAKGGIASYDVGGSVKSDLYKLDPQELQEIIKNTTSDTVRRDAQRIAKMKELGLASGGIIAFADGNDGKAIYGGNKTAEDYRLEDSEDLKARREADIAAARALRGERDAEANRVISSIMFDQMKNQDRGAQLLKPENFVAPTVTPAAKPVAQKGWQALFGIDPNAAPASRGIASAGPRDIEADIAESAPVATTPTASTVAARNERGETVEEQERLNAPPTPVSTKKEVRPAAPAAPAVRRGIEQVSDKNKIPGLSQTMQALYERSLPEERSIQDIIRETRKAREETIGVDKAAQEERARLMAEKTSLKEEAERNKSLRLAQFFASWGSTPGNTLVAGMQAFNKAVPGMIEDEKEARKAQNEVSKIIRELDKAARAEEEGDFDAAFKIKQNAAKDAKDLNKAMLQLQGTKEAAQVRATGSDKVNQEKMLLTAQRDLGAARRALTDLRTKNKALYEAASMPVLPNESKILTEKRDKAKAEIERIEAVHLAQIEEAQNTIKALRKHGDISVPSESEEKPKGGEAKVKKWNPATGKLE